jgi:hypothetical protein
MDSCREKVEALEPLRVTRLRILTLHGLHRVAFRSAKRRSFAERTATLARKTTSNILNGVVLRGNLRHRLNSGYDGHDSCHHQTGSSVYAIIASPTGGLNDVAIEIR